jgi:hypothetical protein
VWKSEVNVDRRTVVGWTWVRRIRLRYGQVTGCSESGDGLSGSIKCGEKSCLAEDLLASQENLCSTDLVGISDS